MLSSRGGRDGCSLVSISIGVLLFCSSVVHPMLTLTWGRDTRANSRSLWPVWWFGGLLFCLLHPRRRSRGGRDTRPIPLKTVFRAVGCGCRERAALISKSIRSTGDSSRAGIAGHFLPMFACLVARSCGKPQNRITAKVNACKAVMFLLVCCCLLFVSRYA